MAPIGRFSVWGAVLIAFIAGMGGAYLMQTNEVQARPSMAGLQGQIDHLEDVVLSLSADLDDVKTRVDDLNDRLEVLEEAPSGNITTFVNGVGPWRTCEALNGHGYCEDNGRTLEFNKRSETSLLRITYTDRMGFIGTGIQNASYFVRITDIGSIVAAYWLYDYIPTDIGPSAVSAKSITGTVVNYVSGIPAGPHILNVVIDVTEGYAFLDNDAWILEVQEVEP